MNNTEKGQHNNRSQYTHVKTLLFTTSYSEVGIKKKKKAKTKVGFTEKNNNDAVSISSCQSEFVNSKKKVKRVSNRLLNAQCEPAGDYNLSHVNGH